MTDRGAVIGCLVMVAVIVIVLSLAAWLYP